jgi:hypothetical protein
MNGSLVPALDPAPLPGPGWLFQALWLVTFFIHLLFVNAVLGGTLLAAVARPAAAGTRGLRELVVTANGWTISFAITFGIAPLLFVQVMLGRFFYSATILVAWAWFGMLGLLMVGYYLNYVVKFRMRSAKPVGILLGIEALCFLCIASVLVTVNLLHAQPATWAAIADRPWRALADPAFVPRLAHFVLAAVSMAGALVALVAVRRARRDTADRVALDGMARFGLRATLAATVLQLIDGFWLLMTLPESVLRTFMRGGAATMVPLLIGVLAGVLLLVVLAQISRPLDQPDKVRRAIELVVAAMIPMIVTRHEVRAIYLGAARASEHVAVAPQWGIFAIFLVVFLAGVVVTAWAMMRAVKDRPPAGEPAA